MKFPINQLLYLVIFGLLGLSGWQFWEALQEQRNKTGEKTVNAVAAKTSELIEEGRSRKADRKGADYTAREPWISFYEANLIGKVPPPPPTPDDKPAVDEPVADEVETPLEDICSIRVLYYDGDQSIVTVAYLPEANVDAPPEVTARSAKRPNMSAPPSRSRPRGVAQPTMPVAFSGIDGLSQQLSLEDKLWPPYDHIRLARVDESARYAEFVRSKGGEESEPEKFFKDEMQMGQELLKRLSELQEANKIGPVRGGGANGDGLDEEPGIIVANNKGWKGDRSTLRIGNDYHVGTDDWDTFGNDPQRLLNRELPTSSYSRGGVKGVQIKKVSPRLQSFGVVASDVITHVNGIPVTSKTEAIKVGKRLHRQGVRNYQVTFLSRGREVVRNYVAPNR